MTAFGTEPICALSDWRKFSPLHITLVNICITAKSDMLPGFLSLTVVTLFL